jgi:hypothetical protein
VIESSFEIPPGKPGRPKKRKRKAYANHGESDFWQFRFPKTPANEVISSLLEVKSAKELQEKFGITIDDDLEWKSARKFVLENILITLARRGLKNESSH